MDIEKLHSDIRSSLCSNPITSTQLDSPSPHWSIDSKGFLLLDNEIYVPNTSDLRLQILQYKHDHPISGHFGQNQTMELVRREYIWLKLRDSIKSYIKSCTTCMHSKSQRHHPYGLLKQLPIPERPWNSISMDFIKKLPMSDGSNTIPVIINHLTKQLIFILTVNTIMSPMLAKLFVLHIFSKHGVPSHVTSDRSTEFISAFFHSLSKVLDMKLHFTLGYHPEGDGQTECTNQTLKQYLRVYCNYQQSNWSNLLPIVEFAYNNTPNATTGLSPFYANKGYHLNLFIHPERDVASIRAQDYAVDLNELHRQLRSHISDMQKQYSASANKCQTLPLDFKIGDKVFVKSDNIRTTQPSKKFTEKFLGPFEILAQVGSVSFTLRLPDSMRSIHPIFHVSMLEPSTPNEFLN